MACRWCVEEQPMPTNMPADELRRLLEAHPPTAGMYVRVHGNHLILGRREPIGPDGRLANDDRVRLTQRSAASYGLSVKRHTGRWERTPFTGTLQEMVDVIRGCMQHLVAPY
jgi:hypothetical protein